MKRKNLLLFLFAGLMISACRDFSVDSEGMSSARSLDQQNIITPGDPFEIRQGDTIPIEGTNLSLEFSLVTEESRCPSNVTCIHAGSARILLTVHDGANEQFQMVASIPGLVMTPYRINNNVQFNGLRFQLLRLSPYPVNPDERTPESEYIALMDVSSVFGD